MTGRELPLVYDDLTRGNSEKLTASLSAFAPASWTRAQATWEPTANPDHQHRTYELPSAHHLLYFNPAIPAEQLLPDGTDPLQSPGEPFVRRMWAGGSLRVNPRRRPLDLRGRRAVCVERIRDVHAKGRLGDEKVFVGIERRIADYAMTAPGDAAAVADDDLVLLRDGGSKTEEDVRRLMAEDDEEEMGNAQLIERRNFVFMRERGQAGTGAQAAQKQSKILKPQHTPDFEHALTPTPSLLFRYSALTFNAHAIHLDRAYCRDVEGHRDLLFHGPLSLTLLLALLDGSIDRRRKRVGRFDYRNLAPLYANEPLRLCGKEGGEGKYELWIENVEGGVSVKGTATTFDVKGTEWDP